MAATTVRLRPRRVAPLVASPQRIRALDGIRGLAVAAVVAYHLDESALPGGYLGVDVFFVLSGFLVTTLLLREWESRGRVDLPAFWRRRARRIVPPLLLLLLAVALAVPTQYADVAARVRGQLLAALLQVPNWFEALAGRSYFDDIGRPSPLRHLWSLGVEMQFYVVWPFVGALALFFGGRRLLGFVAAVGAAGSFGGMALAFAPGTDPSRLYYGTDTRIGTLLVGALVAAAVSGDLRRPEALPPRLIDAVAALAVAAVVLFVLRLDGTSAAAYRGGLLAVALLVGLVIAAAAAAPSSAVRDVLGIRPLVWLGTRSYALYLWHWPVFTATRPGLDVGLGGWRLLVVRLGLTFVLAEASTRIVERGLRAAAAAPPLRARRLTLAAVAGVAATGLAGTSAASTSGSGAFYVSPTTTTVVVTTTSTTALPSTTTVAIAVAPAAATTMGPVPPPASEPLRVLAVGESVLMGAGGHVQQAIGPDTVVDADVGRQPEDVLDALERRRRAGHVEGVDVLVVQLGTNGRLERRHLDRLAVLAEGVRRVVAVSVWVSKPWQDATNAALRDAAVRWRWFRVADWHALAAAHPDWLGPDGVHVGPTGARHYAALVADAVRRA